ncbi:hypothetical protein L2E82_11769 [Cichorium intybus]|uniref:Uncharacterized protein n=1 Tax=Cichorium intybus TaxID=13427 RepID=A0ACB9GFE2_CICIN|nr:hypothetical protein L2E82_11769 [Cichorium intybus]
MHLRFPAFSLHGFNRNIGIIFRLSELQILSLTSISPTISKLVFYTKQSFSSEFIVTFSFSGKPTVNKVPKLGEPVILGIAIDGCALAFVLLALIMILRQNVNGNGSLVFFEGSSLAFDLEDLFRSSTEVLGKGTFGTTYKAALEDAIMVVVKRLKEVEVISAPKDLIPDEYASSDQNGRI